jgi:hypothetical protein
MRFLLIIFIFLFINNCFGQKISGKIIDSNFKKINSSISIILKENIQQDKIIDYQVSYNSTFAFNINKPYKSLILEVKAFGYKNFIKTIENIVIDNAYNFEIVLIKDTITRLDEVTIKSKKKFQVKKDTIIYNVDAYKTASDRKVIDVIKKLPGIEIDNKTGNIKYNGKLIETVLLEGDNLFDSNYSVGTRNINIGMIKEIQAIDKFSENPLLKNIEKSNKVALNLVFKDKNIDFSIDFSNSIGLFNSGKLATDINSNILTISKKQKDFSNISYNNIGNNHSSFDYSGNSVNLESIKESHLKIAKIIPETILGNSLDNDRTNINNQVTANVNHIFTSSKKIKIKANLFYIKDKIKNNNFYENSFLINNKPLIIYDSINVEKKPTQLRSDLDIKILSSENSFFNYNISVRNETIETPSIINSNSTNNFNSNLYTTDFFLKQYLQYTHKITNNKALQIYLLQSINNVDQNFDISQNINSVDFLNSQNINTSKKNIEIKGVYLGTDKENSYNFSIGAKTNQIDIISHLSEIKNSSNTIEQRNNISYLVKNINSTATYTLNFGGWSFNPILEFNYFNQQLLKIQSEENLTQSDFLLNTKLESTYKINRTSYLRFFADFEQNLISENYLFENQILTSNRLSKKNTPNLNLQKQKTFGFSYSNNDLYNQLQINTSFYLQRNKGNFFSNTIITENNISLNYFFLPEYNNVYNMNLRLVKYVSFLESTIKFNLNYILSNFKNIINNSDLQNVNNKNLDLKFSANTAFASFFNFENTFTFNNSNTTINDISPKFKNSTINNKLKIILNPYKNYTAIVTNNYYIPNISKSSNFNFIDFNLSYRKDNYDLGFSIKNILNTKTFEEIQVTDISTNIFRNNLLERHFLFNFSFNF